MLYSGDSLINHFLCSPFCSNSLRCFYSTDSSLYATVPPFTPEDIAAIRSDPLGLKIVQLRLSCKICHVELRTYTGLERNDKLEAKGWIWYESLLENFPCECADKRNVFSLRYIRTGLNGVLRRSFTPAGKATASTVDTVRLYERTALEQDCREFLKLIRSKAKEEEVQKFLESHTIFFSSFLPAKLMVKKPVLTKYIVDFAVVNQRKELLLIEIERPGIPLVKKDGGIRSELQHAIDQVRRWIQVFNDHRSAALESFGLKLADVARVKGVVIAGRTPLDEKQARLLRATSWGDIEFFTYDDLLEGTSDIIKQIATI